MKRLLGWAHLGDALRIVLVAMLATVWHPASQALMLNLIDPWCTQTMATRARQHLQAEGELAWPDYRPISLDQIPDPVVRAALTSEDQRFFEHRGFDWAAIEAALAHNAKGGKMRGGSTISQQVARNVWLWQGRTWVRKGLEAWYTIWLELFVPKRRILELYLNIAELGPMTFGVEAAAQRWYGKPAAKLSRTEAASIVALLPAPRSRKPGSAYVQKRAAWITRHAVALPEDWR